MTSGWLGWPATPSPVTTSVIGDAISGEWRSGSGEAKEERLQVRWHFQDILSSFCGKLSKLFDRTSVSATTKKKLKVILHELPGGAKAFELMAKFCYSNGRTQLTPTNTCILHFAANFMDITELVKQTEESIAAIPHWSWSEVLNALKQCEDFFRIAETSGIFDKVLESLVSRIMAASDTSPSASSPESIGLRFSSDTRSSMSMKSSNIQNWWFEDLLILNSVAVERTMKCLISRKFDQVTISRFLLYFLKCKVSSAKHEEKRRVTEIAIKLLYNLDAKCVSYKGLFEVLRICSSQSLSKCCRIRLECMIGSQIERATLDNLLVQAPTGAETLYDVSLVLRFLKFYRDSEGHASITRLKRVGSLMDLYISEVSPDPCLKSSKFVALILALPDAARDSHDAIYQAIDMYLQVHVQLSEEEKREICSTIDIKKLSVDQFKHLAHNSRFPSKLAIQALISQQSKLRNLLKDSSPIRPSFFSDSLKEYKHIEGEQISLYAKKLDISMENEKLMARLQGMQWRVVELERACQKMQNQMAKVTNSRLSRCSGTSGPLPRLCP